MWCSRRIRRSRSRRDDQALEDAKERERGDAGDERLRTAPEDWRRQTREQKIAMQLVGLTAAQSGRPAREVVDRLLSMLGEVAGSGARVLVCLESLHRDVAAGVLGDTGVTAVVTTSELDYRARDDQRRQPHARRSHEGG